MSLLSSVNLVSFPYFFYDIAISTNLKNKDFFSFLAHDTDKSYTIIASRYWRKQIAFKLLDQPMRDGEKDFSVYECILCASMSAHDNRVRFIGVISEN